MSLPSRYASAEHDFNKQCRLFQRICTNLFTDLGIRDIIKTRNEERNNLIKRSKNYAHSKKMGSSNRIFNSLFC